jgi:competence protein ComFC
VQQQEKIIFFFHKLSTLFLESLFPRRCFGCGVYETFLCPKCYQKVPRRLPATRLIATGSHTALGLDSLTSATYFRAPIVSRLVHNFKYQGMQELSDPLSRLMLESIQHTSIPLPGIITAVPLHTKRLRARGYNQSELLAQKITTSLNNLVPLVAHLPLLKKVKNTLPQSKQKNREMRLTNLSKAFVLNEEFLNSLEGKTIWLIDDVATTQTTLNECALILKSHGVANVHGFVIAH